MHSSSFRHSLPALLGAAYALGAAAMFGLGTPLIKSFGAHVGAFTTAALLYAGAAAVGALTRSDRGVEAGVTRSDLPRLLFMVLFGAIVGPVALAWGLQRTSATAASLLLTLEAVFTALLAGLFYREGVGRRVLAAMGLLTGGAMVLVLDGAAAGPAALIGSLAVVVATLAWAADNTASRGVSMRDPGRVVMLKGGMGAVATTLVALAIGEPGPPVVDALGLFGVGALAYGVSLRLYLLAQRHFGAARTGSVFGFAPLIGAAAAVALGERALTWPMGAAALMMLAGIALHLLEAHDHEHVHDAVEHEHAHAHDDGHHDHVHAEPVVGVHSHAHRHEARRHTHPHVPDPHHTHSHT